MFKLVVVILCFATLLVSTGSALKKDEYEINIKHASFAVHQRHSDAPLLVPTVAPVPPGSASAKENVQRNEQFFGAAGAGDGAAAVEDEDDDGDEDANGEKLSTTLAVPRPTFQSAGTSVHQSNSVDRKLTTKLVKSVDFGAVSPGLEEVPLQPNIFHSSQGRAPSSSYQSLELDFRHEPAKERDAIVKPISAQDFYNNPQLRDRGPVLFSSDTTTTTTASTTTTAMATTTAKPAGKLLKSIPKSAVQENEEIYLLLKYEHPRKQSEGGEGSESEVQVDQAKANAQRDRQQAAEAARRKSEKARPSGTRGRPQPEATTSDNFLQEGIRAGGSFTTVGYFVNDAQTTTPMAPVSTSTKTPTSGNTVPTDAPGWNSAARGSPNKLRNSYGDYLSGDFRDWEDSIRPIEENSEDSGEAEEEASEGADDATSSPPEDIDANLDIIEMTRILAGRQGGLTIAEFNKLFRDYLKKDITVDDLEEFAMLDGVSEDARDKPAAPKTGSDPTKSFDIRAENGKKSQKTANGLPGPTEAQKQQLEKLKVLVNKPPVKMAPGGRKEKLVKIGYGGSKSFQGVYKSPKFLEKVKAERMPLLSDGPWGYRQPQPMREIGPMAYVDNPVFGFVPGGGRARMLEPKSSIVGGQSYVKFQKIS